MTSSDSTTFIEAWLPGPSSTQFYTRTYISPNPSAVVVFVHGFAEHIGRYAWAHAEFAKRGVTVFTYDQRGFGRTALDKEKRSKDSAYGKTSGLDQLKDIEWWVAHAKREFAGLPVFLMGHSMGGGLVLAFGTRTSTPPERESLQSLSGIIASSPLIHQTFPASKLLRYIGGKASSVLPYLLIDAPVPVEDLSHDPVANEANVNDPWIIQKGSLRGLHDMLSGGEELLATGFKHWAPNLPLLVVHGDADRVTSFKAAREFFDKVGAEDKTFTPFEGGFHELVHEPDGVKEKFIDCCSSWVSKHVEGSVASKL